jgi:hypothetical protein
VCSEISTSRDCRGGPNIEEMELLAAVNKHRSAWPVREEMTFVDGQDGEQRVNFKHDGGTTE